jgi:hypothetical protein
VGRRAGLEKKSKEEKRREWSGVEKKKGGKESGEESEMVCRKEWRERIKV